MELGGLPVEDDVSPGDWVAAALRPFDDHGVGSLVPPVFDGYVRVFHPAVRRGLKICVAQATRPVVRSMYTREEVVRKLHTSRTREVAVR